MRLLRIPAPFDHLELAIRAEARCFRALAAKGSQFFLLACEHDLEGIVAKWKFGT
jgi:ATP-dependent DNA ligase